MSSKEVLSEGELDALMDSVASGEAPVGDAAIDPNCPAFDFATREQNLLAEMPALQSLNEKLCLGLGQGILSRYRISSLVELQEIQLVKLDQAISGITGPSAINLIKSAPLNGLSYVVLPGAMLSFFVDTFFGGAQGGAKGQSARETLTPMEWRINDVLTGIFLSSLKESWSDKVVLTPELVSIESTAEFLQASSPDELALQLPFSIKVGEWQGAIDWILPYAALEPLRLKLGKQTPGMNSGQSGTSWEKHFRAELLAVDLEVRGGFIPRRVTIAEVLELKPGSIVPLKTATEVIVYIEGQAFSRGEHGVLNGNKSVMLKEFIRDEFDAM